MLLTEEPLIPRREISKRPIPSRDLDKGPRRSKSSENVHGKGQREAKEARQRARQKARNMFSGSDHTGFSLTSSGEGRSKVKRPQSADYGCGGLYWYSNTSTAMGPSKRTPKSSSTTSRSQHKTVRSHSDPAYYYSSTAVSNSPSLVENGSAKNTIPQGLDSFLSQSQHSKIENFSPKKPALKQSIDDNAIVLLSESSAAPRMPSRRQSVDESSFVSEFSVESAASLHASFVSCPNFITMNQCNNVEGPVSQIPKRRLSTHGNAKSVIDAFNSSIVIEFAWPGMESTSSSASQSQQTVASSIAPRMPARRMSNHDADKALKVPSTESPETELLFNKALSPQTSSRSASALLEIGNESFASIGREYIFEDLNRVPPSPQKTPKKVNRPNNPAQAFYHSAQLSFSDDLSSMSATSAESDDTRCFAHPEIRRCLTIHGRKSFA
eukprot:scaffold2767_cov177-Amphora_coffeaeformis.AAC.88